MSHENAPKKSASPASSGGSLTALLSGEYDKGDQTATGTSSGATDADSIVESKTTADASDHAIIRDIQDNIEATPVGDESPTADEAFNKSGVRVKLGVKDILLILYLIVTIKPFKYIGDRTLSQTKKWEVIQNKFAQHKQQQRILAKADTTLPISVPTVRTLQRQLTSAIKKGKIRFKNSSVKLMEDLPISDPPIFKSITKESLLSDMEMALYELFELSESLKSGKIGNASSFDLSVTSDSPPMSPTHRALDGSLPSTILNSVPPSAAKKDAPSTADASTTNPFFMSNMKNINLTRGSLREFITDDGTPALVAKENEQTITSLLEQLLHQTEELLKESHLQVNRLLQDNNRTIEDLKLFQADQLDINKSLVYQVIGFLKNTDSVSRDTLKRLDQLQ